MQSPLLDYNVFLLSISVSSHYLLDLWAILGVFPASPTEPTHSKALKYFILKPHFCAHSPQHLVAFLCSKVILSQLLSTYSFSCRHTPFWCLFLYFIETLIRVSTSLFITYLELVSIQRWTLSCTVSLLLSSVQHCSVLLSSWGLSLHPYPDLLTPISTHNILTFTKWQAHPP